jgi:RNA polymerase sigma-70 factor (ECF subfamily)
LVGKRFNVPVGAALDARVADVADIAYLAFTAAYAPGSGADVVRADEAGEAVRLVQVLRSLVRYDDLDALLALMMLQHARRDARVVDGRLVRLSEQDRTRWRMSEIADALALLTPLARRAPSTPYLLQALIAAEHSNPQGTDWDRVCEWYAELETLTGSPVVRLNRAVAVAEASTPAAGLELLAELDLPGHRLHAVRAELLQRAGQLAEAQVAYEAAIAACENTAERDHLVVQLGRTR